MSNFFFFRIGCIIDMDFLYFFFRMQSVQNFGLAVITTLAGLIVDSGGYLLLEVFFLAWLCGKDQFFWYFYCNLIFTNLIFFFFFSFVDSDRCHLDLRFCKFWSS